VADIDLEQDVAFPGESLIHEAFTRLAIGGALDHAPVCRLWYTEDKSKVQIPFEKGQTGLSVAYDLPALMVMTPIPRCQR